MAVARKIRNTEGPQIAVVNPINTILAKHKIPTDSYVRAVQYCNDELTRFSPVEQATIVSELVGAQNVVSHKDERLNKYTFLYLVQEAIRAGSANKPYDIQTVYQVAQDRASKFVAENPWIFAGADRPANGITRVSNPNSPKKGWKQEKAAEIYQAHKGKTRKELIAIFVKELDMSTAGASTYVHSMKKKFS